MKDEAPADRARSIPKGSQVSAAEPQDFSAIHVDSETFESASQICKQTIVTVFTSRVV
jgi:hypothetical protein